MSDSSYIRLDDSYVNLLLYTYILIYVYIHTYVRLVMKH